MENSQKRSLIRIDKTDIIHLGNQDNSLSKEITDEMAVPTYLHNNPLITWLFWRRYEEILRFARLQESDHVLEFGCGLGVFLPTLYARTKHVYAIDLFPSYAQLLCRQRQMDVQFIENLENCAENQFDLVIAADVMEHLDQPQDYYALFQSRIKPGGRLILSGPTENYLYRFGRFLAGYSGKIHYHRNNIYGLERIAREMGFILKDKSILPFRFLPPLFNILLFENPPKPK